MNCLYRIIIIFVIVAAMLGLPQIAKANPLAAIASSNLHPSSAHPVEQSADYFYKLGAYKVLIKDYEGAINNFAQAIKLNPNDAKVYSNQGLAHAALGDWHKAVKDFQQALHLNPNLAEAYYNRGFVRSQLQDYQGAIADFSQVIKLNPKDADAYHCRCLVHYALGNKQGVIKDLQKAADLYLQQGKTKEYQGLLDRIKKLNSTVNFSVY